MKEKIPPRVELICVGTELLTGKVNTHTAYLGPKLAEIGLHVACDHTVGDDPRMMKEIFKRAFHRADIVITAGGLGPTFDDLTRDVWSEVLNLPLQRNKRIVSGIQRKFRSRGYPMPEVNRRQGDVLKGAKVLSNNHGTAPGQYWERGEKVLVLLPGPARELYPMMERQVLPRLKSRFSSHITQTKTFLLVGVPESRVDEMIRPFVEAHERIAGCRVLHGILASQSVISVKFTVDGTSRHSVRRAVAQLSKEMRRLIGPFCFGEDHDTLEGVIGRLLQRRRQTLAVAESCTGGLISKMITDHPGASDYFLEGDITYHNDSKRRRLGVRRETLKKWGAVSEQTAREMAVGLLGKTGVHYALSVTGIAGPKGGSASKPVGLVYIGCAGPRRTVVREFRFKGDRSWIRHRSAVMALDILRQEILR